MDEERTSTTKSTDQRRRGRDRRWKGRDRRRAGLAKVDIGEEQIVILRLGHISVRSGFFGFWGENPPTDPPFLGSGGGDPSLTVISIGSAGSWAGSDELGGWVGSRFLLDTTNSSFTFGNKFKNYTKMYSLASQ